MCSVECVSEWIPSEKINLDYNDFCQAKTEILYIAEQASLILTIATKRDQACRRLVEIINRSTITVKVGAVEIPQRAGSSELPLTDPMGLLSQL